MLNLLKEYEDIRKAFEPYEQEVPLHACLHEYCVKYECTCGVGTR